MRAIVLSLALLGSALAVPRTTQRIVGGSSTTVETYPYMANMEFGFWGIWWGQSCGGSLISTTHILSAAHCYFGDLPSSWRVRLGSSMRTSGGDLHEVSRLVNHEQYSGATLDNDVAIVYLRSPAVFSDRIGAARIAGTNFNLPDGTSITAIGFGHLQHQGTFPEQLQHVALDVINQELCAERYAYLKTQPGFSRWPDITPGMLCAGILDVGGKDACQGDSGGPVSVLNREGDIVVGVVSWGYNCADAFYPGVLARVSVYADWIVRNAL